MFLITKYLFLFLTTFSSSITTELVFEKLGGSPLQGPPPPDDPPVPPGLPINENFNFIIAIALFFGVYMIYRHSLKKKSN